MHTSTNPFSSLKRLILYRLFIASGLFFLSYRGILPLAYDGALAASSVRVLVGTLFFLTIVYLIWLRTKKWLSFLTRLQCALDPLLITVLVVLTGSQDSPLHFLYGLSVLTTAMLLGRRDALLVAAAVWLLSLISLPIGFWLFASPIDGGYPLLRQMVLHGVAYLMTALLGGTIAEKASGLEKSVALQKDSLANLEALNRQIVEAIPYGLITVNNSGIVRTVSEHALDLLPNTVGPVVARPLAEVSAELYWVLTHAGHSDCSVEVPMRGGGILAVNTSVLRDHRHQIIGTLIVLGDLTEIKKLESELRIREKMGLAGRMAAVLAHEIRNPLASLLSATQMLGQSGLEGHQDRLKEIIIEEVLRLKQLTTDFLYYSRPTEAVANSIALKPFLVAMQEKLVHDPVWGSERLLHIDLADNVCVLMDANHLFQILWNLLINAAQASPAGQPVEVRYMRSGNRIRLLIEDYGTGMMPEDLNRALEPFYTTRATGTGLGLAVVDQLMRQNKGSVSLFNRLEGGLRVVLSMEMG